MSDYVLSLNVDNKKNCYAIFFDGENGAVQNCLYDSNVNFDEFVKNKIVPIAEIVSNDIILDENGYGRALKDSLLKNGIRVAYSIKLPYIINQYIALCYKDAVDNLKIMENDDTDRKEIEKELLNLKIQRRTNNERFIFIKKDDNIDDLKAKCYLQGFVYTKYMKEKRDININDLNYIRNMYDHDMQIYDLLSSKERYLKRQMNQDREKHSGEITSKMNEELLYTQKELIKTINNLHVNFEKWLNIEKKRLENEYDNNEYSRLVENK